MLKKNVVSSIREEAVLCGGLFVCVVVLAGLLFFATTANADLYGVHSFSELVTSNLEVHSYINYDTQVLDNLMIKNLDGSESIVSGKWSMGFVAGTDLIGYADNAYPDFPGAGGWLAGGYNSLLGSNNHPTGLFLAYDSTGNGWDIIGGVLGSEQDLIDGDLFFTEDDILFGPLGLQGDLGIGLLPAYSAIGEVGILPHMVVVIPEPATLLLLGLGGILISKRKF